MQCGMEGRVNGCRNGNEEGSREDLHLLTMAKRVAMLKLEKPMRKTSQDSTYFYFLLETFIQEYRPEVANGIPEPLIMIFEQAEKKWKRMFKARKQEAQEVAVIQRGKQIMQTQEEAA